MEDNHLELFIDLVRERKVIWCKRENGYKDSRGVKLNNFKDIVSELERAFPNSKVKFTGMFIYF